VYQHTAAVRRTQSVSRMSAEVAKTNIECGTGKVLQGLVMKISQEVETRSL